MGLMPSPSVWSTNSTDPALAGRVTTLENKRIRTARFASISSGTSGTLTLPTNSTVVLDDFGGTIDAVITTQAGGRPTYNHAVDGSGNLVTTTFDSSGNYVLSAAPVSYPVSIIYRVYQLSKDFTSSDADIVGGPEVVGLVDSLNGLTGALFITNGATTPSTITVGTSGHNVTLLVPGAVVHPIDATNSIVYDKIPVGLASGAVNVTIVGSNVFPLITTSANISGYGNDIAPVMTSGDNVFISGQTIASSCPLVNQSFLLGIQILPLMDTAILDCFIAGDHILDTSTGVINSAFIMGRNLCNNQLFNFNSSVIIGYANNNGASNPVSWNKSALIGTGMADGLESMSSSVCGGITSLSGVLSVSSSVIFSVEGVNGNGSAAIVDSVIFGHGAMSGGTFNTLSEGIIFGSGAGSTIVDCVNIALFGTVCEPSSSTALNEVCFGSGEQPFSHFWLGNGGLAIASPTDTIISPTSTDTSSASLFGVNLDLWAGMGTGSGGSGSLRFFTGAPTGPATQTTPTLAGEFDNLQRFNTKSGRIHATRVVTAAGAVTVTVADDWIVVKKGTGAATTVNLPASPATGTEFTITDGKFDAATNNITITPAAGNINNAATYVMNTNGQSAMIRYDGAQWLVV